MADDFKDRKNIIVQPNDVAVPFGFEFTICSAADKNDGALPYGDSVASCAVSAHLGEDGTDKTSELINGTPSVAANVVTVDLDYPSTTGHGVYHLTFVVTTANGVDIEFDFNRVHARDI